MSPATSSLSRSPHGTAWSQTLPPTDRESGSHLRRTPPSSAVRDEIMTYDWDKLEEIGASSTRLFQLLSQNSRPSSDSMRSELARLIADGIPITWREVTALARSGPESGRRSIPPFVVEFLLAALSDRKGQGALDPWSRYGILSAPLSKQPSSDTARCVR